MENGWRSKQEAMISELIQGMELAKQLREELCSISPTEDNELSLVEGILSAYEKALSALKWSGPTTRTQTVAVTANLPTIHTQTQAVTACLPPIHTPTVAVTMSLPTSPTSVDGSPHSDDFDISFKDLNDLNKGLKKRKSLARWIKQVRVSSETGLEGSCDDGHNWRKYGQKDILGAKYPRSYYRCTYRNSQDCWATKQVQRSDEDPSVFEITYRGKHNCSHGNNTVPPPISPEKQEQKQINYGNDIGHERQPQNTTSTSLCPSTGFGLTDTDSKNHQFSHPVMDDNNWAESFSLTPESSYVMQFPCQSNLEGFQSLYESETNITDTLFSQNYNYFY